MDRHEDKKMMATAMDWRNHARGSQPPHHRYGGVRIAHRTGSTPRSVSTHGRDPKTDKRKGLRMDHRQGNRYRVFRLVEVQYDDATQAPGLLYNVSRNGMFVLTSARPGVNGCVDVCIRSPDAGEGAGEAVNISAQVVYHSDCGVGLIFRELDVRAEGVIEALCA